MPFIGGNPLKSPGNPPDSREAIAHIRKKEDGNWDQPHDLEAHINGVAILAEGFATSFGNGDWGRISGLWHDLGKYRPAFQEYIRKSSGYENDAADEGGPGRVDHSVVGALWAAERFADYSPEVGRALGYLIAGHHAGLPDWSHEVGIGGALGDRLKDRSNLVDALSATPPDSLLKAVPPGSSPCGRAPSLENDGIMRESMHLWIWMLFSCLVDADFLDTESYMDPRRTLARTAEAKGLSELKRQFDDYMAKKVALAPQTPVNAARAKILAECRSHAEWEPGMFSLTVPTGGGKTLSSMAFALEHAIKKGKSRIIIAIPYTSIIEQTAKQYRDIFGDDAVLEHHSNLDPDKETGHSRLASENWDAPIIVTTNVQLFESLFASRTSACRKLHRLVNSVIILDEAQMLPPGYLQPIVSVLKGLTEMFGASVVLCTATQPVLSGKIESGQAILKGFAPGSVRELMTDPAGLAKILKRVELRCHPKGDEVVSWEEIAGELAALDQVICIVNTRKDCRALYDLLPEGAIHLSALMCPEHRSVVIGGVNGIKAKLARNEPLRVVSTQLVEAGVDIDFPVVYRALAGLDSMAQAAGRCNREGRLNVVGQLGQTIIFRPPKDAPSGLLRKGQDAGSEILRCFPKEVAELDPEVFKRYFELYYGKVNSFDTKGIMKLLSGPDIDELKIQFRTAASRFSLIENAGQKAVIVWYERKASREARVLSSVDLIARLEKQGPDRGLMRALQRFTVTVPIRAIDTLKNDGSIRELRGMDGLYVQNVAKLYDSVFGLRLEGPNLSALDFIA